ncbi:hypothetical protein BBC0122_003950 [Bartonella choladocola]|uniref:Uncharacterized protein n=1 Tax=Bartonella choladocola TaxID=2750995 RepID=A0A1U9MFP8_9HYPH|nr:hypothetical protein BBC0122_003950 [Bartonella choladocola]
MNVFVKTNGEKHDLWRAVHHNGKILEYYVLKKMSQEICQVIHWEIAEKSRLADEFCYR